MWRILRIFFLFFFASVIRNIEQLRIIKSDTRGSCSREENKTIIWKSVQKIQTFKRWQQFASKTDTIERKQNRRAIALLRKSRLFPGKRVINNNRTLDLTLSLSFHFRRSPLLKPHPLSPSLFLLWSTTTPPPPHPAAFQGRSSRETEVKTRGCRVRVTFINNGTRDKPRPPPYYGVFLRSACRENPPSSPPSPPPAPSWRGMFPTEKTLSPFCRKFGDDISGIRIPGGFCLRGTRHRCVTHCEMEVSRFRLFNILCRRATRVSAFPPDRIIHRCIRSTCVKIDYRNNKIC